VPAHYREGSVEHSLAVRPPPANPVDAPPANEIQTDRGEPGADGHGDDDADQAKPLVTRREAAEDRVGFLEDDARDAENDVLPQPLEKGRVLRLLRD
jgi:hypothetical protein